MIARPDILLERACARAGSADFGPDGWQEGFEQIVAAVESDLADDDASSAQIEAIITDRLVTRLRIEQWWAEHGDEAAAPVEGVLAVGGLPRTGTTALHYLLSLDPRFRYLRTWELTDPVPPPDLATEADDPRRPAATRSGDERHIATADGPIEDGPIFALHFSHAETILPVPTYTEWWRNANHVSAFDYHERMLRMLQSHRPPRHWLLKFPNFVFHFPEILGRYPGTPIVMTHRDPAKVVPSTCSVVLAARATQLPDVPIDKVEVGREQLRQFTAAIEQVLAARAALGEEHFLDIGQHELEADPVGAIEQVYAFAGLDLDDTQRARVAAFAVENASGTRGEHQYSATEFGIDEDEVREIFAPYTERFGQYYA